MYASQSFRRYEKKKKFYELKNEWEMYSVDDL